MKRLIFVLALLVFSALLGNANDTSLMAVGNLLVPIQETDISVKYEFYNYLRAFSHLILSTMIAMAPSPVTLHAVPKLSIAIYRAIIRA